MVLVEDSWVLKMYSTKSKVLKFIVKIVLVTVHNFTLTNMDTNKSTYYHICVERYKHVHEMQF